MSAVKSANFKQDVGKHVSI